MAPSESLGEVAPDSPPISPQPIGDAGPHAYGNGHLTDTVDQHQLLNALQAMRLGDFSVRLPGDQTGLCGKIADTFNEIVAANERMAHQLEQVGHIVGREGKTRQRVRLGLLDGAWSEMETSVNTLIDDLLWPTTAVTHAISAVAQGDLLQTVRLDVDGRPLKGEFLRSANIVNTMIKQLSVFTSEVTRVAREVGTDGKLGGQAQVRGVSGVWKDLTESVNSMASNLTAQVRNIAEVTIAVASGDLSKKITVDVRGEILQLKEAINTMVDQLRSFASEVTRVAREVGTEGKLGGQALVPGVAGTWKDLTDSVNAMCGNLTDQVRNIANVTTAVARGDLSRKITVDVRGEILELKDTINTMVDQLNAFASEVTRVAREVGTEGKLGGQADVHGVGGTWKDLTDNVNQLAANLTTQVRAIGEVATAVTRGDLSRSVQVQAQGEVELLKNDVNEMIRNLRVTTQRSQEIDWLKTNIARFGRMLQGQRDLRTVGRMILSELAPLAEVQRGLFYLANPESEPPRLTLLATYPRQLKPAPLAEIPFGEGLIGQCAEDRQRIRLRDVPPDYAPIQSGLGSTTPRSVVILPILFEDETRAVLELASIEELSEIHLAFLDQLGESIGIVLSTITANMRAEDLVQEQAARAEAETGLARLRQVVDVMPEAILLADAFGRVYLSNAAATEIMGIVPETVSLESEAAPITRRVDGGAFLPKDHPLARAVFQSETVRGEQLMISNPVTGRDVPILVNSAPLSDGQGHPAGGVTVFQDISPLRDLDRQKDEFLAAISHDLKTPATIIKGNANLLQRALGRTDRDRSVEIAEGLAVIDESTAQLVRLVDELLDLTRVRMGHELELDVAPADLVGIVRRLAAEYQKISPRHSIRVETELHRILGDWDEARIERIVANLVSNAVKYSPRGGDVAIEVSEEGSGDERWAVIVVRDHGIGIPPGEIERVWEPYYRATNIAGTVSGSGIGLAGTRHIVEQHGGQIAVESAVGDTAFTVRLPLMLDALEALEA